MSIRYVSDLDCYTVTRWGSDEPFAWAETPSDAIAIQEMEAERAGAPRLPNLAVDLGPDSPDDDPIQQIADMLYGADLDVG
jgi:hypothetical protein